MSCFSLVTSSLFGAFLPCCRRAGESVDNKIMICAAVCTTHGRCHSDILSVFPPNYEIDNEMSVVETRVPCGLVHGRPYW